jgi:hypothetical protein
MVSARKVSVLFVSFLLMLLLLPTIPPVSQNTRAQDYSFETLRQHCHVYIEKDGSVHIKYEFEFNDILGTLDGVDVGMPNSFYSLDSATARVYINGRQVIHTIRDSPYIPMGIAVEFSDPFSIDSHIEVFFEADNPHMVYDDVKNPGYAGIQFRPTWFSSEFQEGSTRDLQVWVYLPENLNDRSMVKYLAGHQYSSINWNSSENRLIAHWDYGSKYPQEIMDGDCDVGVSFPDEYVDVHYRYRVWQGIYEGALIWGAELFACCVVMFILGIMGAAAYGNHRRRLDYFEPKLSVKGAGPRAGLTAVEAAIALEKPLNMVATMIIYGMLRKQSIRLISENPLQIQVINEKQMMYEYERNFASDALKTNGTIDKGGMKKFIEGLIESVREKISGFDYPETKRYYKAIVERAWAEVENSGTPEVAANNAWRRGEWLLLDPTYHHRIIVLQDRSWYTSTTGGGASGPNPFVTWSEGFVRSANNISKSVVANLTSFTQDVVNVTNPMPAGGSGGGGGGCACACACACAGGGR